MNSKYEHLYYYLYEIHITNVDSTLYDTYYYGKHETDDIDDNYYGSGKIIRRYIDKYGYAGLEKTILGFFESKEDLAEAEKQLVDNKRNSLGKKCQNLHEGGYGGRWKMYLTKEEYEERCLKVKLGVYTKTTAQDRHNHAVAAGLSKRNVSKERREEWHQHYIEAYKNMSNEDKKAKYNKVSNSLLEWYSNPDNIDVIKQKQIKNKLSNQISSKKWRTEFIQIFGCNAEYFRKYNKMKAAMDLFYKIKSESEEIKKHEVNRFMESLNS